MYGILSVLRVPILLALLVFSFGAAGIGPVMPRDSAGSAPGNAIVVLTSHDGTIGKEVTTVASDGGEVAQVPLVGTAVENTTGNVTVTNTTDPGPTPTPTPGPTPTPTPVCVGSDAKGLLSYGDSKVPFGMVARTGSEVIYGGATDSTPGQRAHAVGGQKATHDGPWNGWASSFTSPPGAPSSTPPEPVSTTHNNPIDTWGWKAVGNCTYILTPEPQADEA